jgi:hypothetical protein
MNGLAVPQLAQRVCRKPLLAGSCHLKRAPRPKNAPPLDQHYYRFRPACRTWSPKWALQHEKHRQLFLDLGSVKLFPNTILGRLPARFRGGDAYFGFTWIIAIMPASS